MGEATVYVCFPSADVSRAAIAKKKWQSKGYKVSLFFDTDRESIDADSVVFGDYKGYWNACNKLAAGSFAKGADVVVFAADDIDPDPNHSAQKIAAEYLAKYPDGFGVMQPAGDLQGIDSSGKPAAARICGSPWFGKGWNDRAYQGKGPTHDGYFHFYGDEDLYEVASRLDVLWVRSDLTQFHRHWSWGHSQQTSYQRRNSSKHWNTDKATFAVRKAEGFPGHEPLVIA